MVHASPCDLLGEFVMSTLDVRCVDLVLVGVTPDDCYTVGMVSNGANHLMHLSVFAKQMLVA